MLSFSREISFNSGGNRQPLRLDQPTEESEKNKLFWVVFWGRACIRSQYMIVFILWPAYVYDNRPEISLLMISIVMAGHSFGNFCTAPLSGIFVSTIGHKSSFTFACAGMGLFLIAFCLCELIVEQRTYLIMCFLTRFTSGACNAFASTASITMVAKAFEKDREDYITQVLMADGVGAFFGLLLLIIFCSFMQVHGILTIIAMLLVIYAFIIAIAIEEYWDNLEQDDLNQSNAYAENAPDALDREEALYTDKVSYGMFFRNKMSATSILITVPAMTILYSFAALNSVYLKELGLTEIVICAIFFVAFSTGLVTMALFKKHLKDLIPYRLRVVSLITSAFAMLLYTVFNPVVYALGMIVSSFSIGLMTCLVIPDILSGTEKLIREVNIQQNQANKPIPIQLHDKGNALGQMAMMCSLSIGPVYGGAMYDAFGLNMTASINSIVCLSILLINIIVLYCWKRQENIQDYDTLDGTRTAFIDERENPFSVNNNPFSESGYPNTRFTEQVEINIRNVDENTFLKQSIAY